MSLTDSISLKVELFHYERLRWIEKEDLGEVAEKLKQENSDWSDQDLSEGLENLRRYYALSILDPLNFHAVPVPLDPFWHTHLLFSRDYIAFCNKVFGQFIHHQPLLYTDQRNVRFVEELYGYTIGLQPQIFNTMSPKWWQEPRPHEPEPHRFICYHMEIVDPIMRAHSLFPKHTLTRAITVADFTVS